VQTAVTQQGPGFAPADGSAPLLDVTSLSVTIPTEGGTVNAVRGVTFEMRSGEVLGVVGESGSGKSMSALAVLGLLPNRAVASGSVRLKGEELLGRGKKELRRLRGNRIAMVFQDPMTALNPTYNIGWQVAEAVQLHQRVGRAAAKQRAVDLLRQVSVPNPQDVARAYPHELSGGMRQRVTIAMAIANQPDVIVADEPTTALDVTVQAQLLELLGTLRAETGAAIMLITHDLGVVAGVADRVQVMYAGRIVESGPVGDVFGVPQMPYTAGLLASIPGVGPASHRLPSIRGTPPSMTIVSPGCMFAPRCPLAGPECAAQPALQEVLPGHWAACHHHQGAATAFTLSDDEVIGGSRSPSAADSGPAVQGVGLVKEFKVRTAAQRRATLHAVSGVDLEIKAGETLGLVGETSCGKSTTARLLLRLEEPDGGTVTVAGLAFSGLGKAELRKRRADIQAVFQDPYAALNPYRSVGDIIAEPLVVQRLGDRHARVARLLEMVGLDGKDARRYPHEFSGGQRQRIGIARALALQPKVLVLDEPVSALDVSIQASILNLLSDLQDELGIAYLFISHDLSVVRHIADRIAVMYMGRIAESGPAEQVYTNPRHPYTRALISAVPIPDPRRERRRQRILLEGDVPSPIDPPSGCRFRTRCWKASDRCTSEVPVLRELTPNHTIACHHPEDPAG
jgi:peptide/nickel transport system ATP-binding protein